MWSMSPFQAEATALLQGVRCAATYGDHIHIFTYCANLIKALHNNNTNPKDIGNTLQDFRQVVNQCTYVKCNKVNRDVVREAHGLVWQPGRKGVWFFVAAKKKVCQVPTQFHGL